MPKPIASILWKRLDAEGHDACRLDQTGGGWTLSGTAIFCHDEQTASLRYRVDCASDWHTRKALVEGWIGARDVRTEIAKSAGGWSLNGVEREGLAGCVDLDLGFTPATNLVALRRFALGVGEETPAPAAYLEFPELKLVLLDQSYRRLDERRYAYQSPRYRYHAVLTVGEQGFVEDYPGLWSGRTALPG